MEQGGWGLRRPLEKAGPSAAGLGKAIAFAQTDKVSVLPCFHGRLHKDLQETDTDLEGQ